MSVAVATLTGEALRAALPELARLRIAVFADWPYLYEGDLDYERGYVRAYAQSAGAIVVGARDGEKLVGAATAAPMEDHAPEFAEPLKKAGYALEDILYCGESVLLANYRGQGIGHAFFDAREAHGRALGRRFSCFCGVRRDPADPRKPMDYRPLDGFWRRRGYDKIAGASASYAWREVGASGESDHPMDVWIRAL